MTKIAMAALGLSVFATTAVAALAFDILRRPDPADACRVQVLTSEERLRDALARASAAHVELIKRLGVKP